MSNGLPCGWVFALALAVGASAAGCAGSRGSAAGVAGTGPVPAAPGGPGGAGIHGPSAPAISASPLAAGGGDRGRELPPPNSGALDRAPDRATEATGSALQRIHFAFDQHTLTAEAREILAGNAAHLRGNGRTGVLVEGHCDERGTMEYNLALGERRAESARQYLQDLGIEPGRMAVVTFGEERPLDPGRNEDAWAQNRRAEFRVVQP